MTSGCTFATDSADEGAYVDREQLDGLVAAAGIAGTRDILDAFWRSSDRLLAALKDQLACGDLSEASKTAHSLKGSAMNVGALQLSLAARAIEEACKASDADRARAQLSQAHDRYANTIGAFGKVFAAKR